MTNKAFTMVKKDKTVEISAKVKRVIFSDKYTIVILNDGRKGIAKCAPGDTFDTTIGVLLALGRAYAKNLE